MVGQTKTVNRLRTAGPPVADEEPGSEASEWEKSQREECLAQVAEEERVLGEGAENSIIFLFSLFIHVKHQKAEEGGRGGHIVAGTLGGSVVAGKGFVICCHDLPMYIGFYDVCM